MNNEQALTEEEKKNRQETEQMKDQKVADYGQMLLRNQKTKTSIQLVSIIGEIEGHENLSSQNKTTKYEHVLPQLAEIEERQDVDGVLFLLNTVGGDVEAGLAIAEMIASLSKPTVSLVLGGSHSIGVPLAVAAKQSFIVPSGTMIIHPVRMGGTILAVSQSFVYMEQIQDRIIRFVEQHSQISYEDFRGLMLEHRQLVKDVGSILEGKEAVEHGIIDQVGGMKEALAYLKERIYEGRE